MNKKIIFFVFRHRFRQSTFNNFLKIKKIKNFNLVNLSGPFRYFFLGKLIIYLVQKFNNYFKNIVMVSCDSAPVLYKSGVNLWFGGTSHKVPMIYKKLNNNCHVIDNFIKKENNLLTFYPHVLNKPIITQKPKIIFVGGFKLTKTNLIKRIWKFEKKNILNNFLLIEKKSFWSKYVSNSDNKIQTYYIELKDLVRFNLITKLHKKFKNDFIIIGNDWKKYIRSSLKSNFDTNYISSSYNGNICIDFGSKWGNNSLYPRSLNIIESNGLLLQSFQSDTKKIFKKSYKETSFKNFDDLIKKISLLLNNSTKYKELLLSQFNIFNNSNLNYKTITKIYRISKK